MTAPDTQTPPAPHWWRRNALGLGALVVLIPLTVGVIAANEWSQYDAGHPTQPIIVQAGDAVRYDGAGSGRPVPSSPTIPPRRPDPVCCARPP